MTLEQVGQETGQIFAWRLPLPDGSGPWEVAATTAKSTYVDYRRQRGPVS